MAKNVQSPKATAGGGYAFEDYVVAYLFCKMLTNSIIFEPEAGTISSIEFQVRLHDWYLDDALLTLVISGTERKCAISIKSAKQITENGFSTDFVSSAWEQYLVGGPFVKERYLLCLITCPLAEGVKSAVSTLLQGSRAQKSGSVEKSMDTPGATNDKVRALFESWVCPQDLVAKFNSVADERIAVLRHIRVLGWDFETDPSENLSAAINLCRGILRSDDLQEARKLWDTLCGIAEYYRPRRGFLTIEDLVGKLRLQFRLKNFPAYEGDWRQLGRHTGINLQQIRDTIGNDVSLDRSVDLQKLREIVQPQRIVLLSGPSGCGKTVLVKKLVQGKLDSATVVWWNASRLHERDYALFEQKLELANPLEELMSRVTTSQAYLVVDGLDRQVQGQVFTNLGTVMHFLHFDNENCPWRVIIPVQDEEVERLYLGLLSAKVPAERIVQL